MVNGKFNIFALFSDDIQRYDLRAEIRRLNALGLGRLWPLSGKKPDLGFLIYEVEESSLDGVLTVLNGQSSIKFADALPVRVKGSDDSESGHESSSKLR